MTALSSVELRRCKMLANYLSSFADTSRESSSTVSWILKQGQQKLGIDLPENMPAYESGFEESGDDADVRFYSMLSAKSRTLTPETLEERKSRHDAVLASLNRQIEEAEAAGEIKPTGLEKNLDLLAETLGLDDADKKLILFYADFVNLMPLFERTRFDFVEDDQYYDRMARFIGCYEDAIRHKLSESHVLRAACIINYDPYDWGTKNKEAFNRTPTDAYGVDRTFLGILKAGEQSVNSLIQKLMGESPATNGLTLQNYAFMEEEITNYIEALRGALADTESLGRAFLIYGPPGVGKTVLTAVMGEALGVPVILVGNSDVSDAFSGSQKEPDRKARIRALQRANYLAKSIGKPMIFVFDEAEDVCIDITDDSQAGGEKGSKGHFNHLLDNLCPVTIFITNKADKFDPAYVRRMNPQLHMPRAPKRIQVEIIQDNCARKGLNISEREARELTGYTGGLAPADIASSVRAVGWRGDIKGNKPAIIRALQTTFTETVKAKQQGVPPLPVSGRRPDFDFGFKNTPPHFEQNTLDLIRCAREGESLQGLSFCFFGQQGSGRRTYLEWLSREMGLEITAAPYASFLNMTGGFSDGAFGTFLRGAEMDRSLVVITNADPIMEFIKDSSFFQRVRNYPFPVAVLLDLQLAEKPQPEQEKKSLPDDPEAAKKMIEAQQMMQTMITQMQSTFAQMGVPLGGRASIPAALKEFTFVEPFNALGKAGIEYAFNKYFGLQAPASAFGLETLTPYDFECVARKAKFLKSLARDPEAISKALHDTRIKDKPADPGSAAEGDAEKARREAKNFVPGNLAMH